MAATAVVFPVGPASAIFPNETNMTTFTIQDQHELADLLRSATASGEAPAPGVLEKARKASKPKKRVPKTKTASPKVTPDSTKIKRLATRVAQLCSQVASAKAALAAEAERWRVWREASRANGFDEPVETPEQVEARIQTEQRAQWAQVNLPDFQTELYRAAEQLAALVASHFDSTKD